VGRSTRSSSESGGNCIPVLRVGRSFQTDSERSRCRSHPQQEQSLLDDLGLFLDCRRPCENAPKGVIQSTDIHDITNRLWSAADELRANSRLKASEYSVPVLGQIFLRYADIRFTQAEKDLAGQASGRRQIGKTDYQARGVLYLPKEARFSTLLKLPEQENIGQAINDALKA